MKMNFPERRKHERFDMLASKIYILDSIKEDILLEGAMDNFSRYGLCIMTQKPLKKGQELTIKDDFTIYPQTAKVRWSKKYNDDCYKAGLEYRVK